MAILLELEAEITLWNWNLNRIEPHWNWSIPPLKETFRKVHVKCNLTLKIAHISSLNRWDWQACQNFSAYAKFAKLKRSRNLVDLQYP